MRSNPRRVAVVTSPAQNSHSSARLPSLQPHHDPLALATVRQFARTHRAAPCDLPPHFVDKGVLFAAELGQPAIDALASGGPGHAPAKQRMKIEMDQRRLVAPIFEGETFFWVIGSRSRRPRS